MGFSLTTFLFEIVNFVVLVWLLGRVVYRPLRDGIARRREALEAREKAAAERSLAAAQREEQLSSRTEQLEELRARTLREATEQAAEERARLLSEARDDAAAERSRAERMVEAERDAAQAWVREVAVRHAASIAGRLLMELAPADVESALLEMLVRELERRSESLRAAAADMREVEVTGARLPPAETVERLRQQLAKVLGHAPRISVHEDEALVAGLVVRAGSVVLDASIAGELDAFRERVLALAEAERVEVAVG